MSRKPIIPMPQDQNSGSRWPYKKLPLVHKVIMAVAAVATAGAFLLTWQALKAPSEETAMPARLTTGASAQALAASIEAPEGIDDIAASSAPASLAPEVAVAIDRAAGYRQRHLAIQNLSPSLSPQDLAALIVFLQEGQPLEHLAAAGERALANDILNLLRNQEPPIPNLAEILTEIFVNEELDVVIRDYAVQHLGAWHPKAPAQDHPFIIDALMAALDQTDSSIAGTSLLALRQLAESDGAMDRHVLAKRAADLARDPEVSQLSRITALQVAADLGSEVLVPLASAIVLDHKNPYPLRLSGIAALKHVGGSEADSILSDLKRREDPYLLTALRERPTP